jgi:agmatinase
MSENKQFGDFPAQYTDYNEAVIVIVPIPYEKSTTYITGTTNGPDAILQASPNLEFYDIETGTEVYKRGVSTDSPMAEEFSAEEMIQGVRSRIEKHIKNKKLTVVLGGEHTVAVGSTLAHVENFRNVSVLQLDAHADLRDSYLGSKYNHACTMARIKEFAPIVQVGIRAINAVELTSIEKDKVFFAKDIYNDSSWVKKVVEQLTENVYITIDLDVFDPSIMPSVGTPEPGGLLWYDIMKLLKGVCEERNLLGFDVVELCPNPNNIAPDFTAAKLIYKLLSYKFAQ